MDGIWTTGSVITDQDELLFDSIIIPAMELL